MCKKLVPDKCSVFLLELGRAKNRVTRTSNADGKRVTYLYDLGDRRTRLTDPDAGRTSTVYDAKDRLIGLINPQGKRTSFAYDLLDRQVRQKHANATYTTHTYDAAGQITRLLHAKSPEIVYNRFTYLYDQVGNRTAMRELNGDRATFSYDKAYQLTRERKSGAATYDVTHSYDPVGNRLVQIDTGTRTTATFDAANQLLIEQAGANRTTYTHDFCGNRTKKDAPAAITIYGWDEDMRLTQAIPPSNRVTMTYNASSKRIKKENPSQTKKFLYDFEKVLKESDAGDATTNSFTSTVEQYGDLVSAYDGTNTSYFQPDALGSTDALIDDSATVNDRYRYRGFGLESHYQGSSTNDRTFVGNKGYVRDSEIDLYFVGARYLDSAAARWLSEDPDGFKAGDINLYRYVGNNPVNGVDPSGKALLVPHSRCYRQQVYYSSGSASFGTGFGLDDLESRLVREFQSRNIAVNSIILPVSGAVQRGTGADAVYGVVDFFWDPGWWTGLRPDLWADVNSVGSVPSRGQIQPSGLVKLIATEIDDYVLQGWVRDRSDYWIGNLSNLYPFIGFLSSSTVLSYRGESTNLRSFTIPTLAIGTWYHACVARRSGVVRAYLNGVESSTGGIADTATFSCSMLAGYPTLTLSWSGKLDSPRVYSRGLASAEVASLFRLTASSFTRT